jgi:proteasome lid subunit RPN8/RPN11
MTVRLSRSLLEQIVAHADGDPAREVCGLLFGSPAAIEGATPASNVAPDPARHFEIAPDALIAAHRAARGGGATVIGHYHSHPGGLAEPSMTDAAAARADGMLWLIVASGDARLWRAGEDGLHGRFRRERLVVA